jgi:hypothetical protein
MEPVAARSTPKLVGWRHSCGTTQLRESMPTDLLSWSDEEEHVCVECGDEPWALGVWNKDAHEESCPWVAAGRSRIVDWSPVFPCTCTAA